MPEVMRQFGQTIIVALAGGLIIAMLFVLWPGGGGGNVLNFVGQHSSKQLQDRGTTGSGTTEFAQHAGRSLPTVVANGAAIQNVQFLLADKFTITSAGGALWSQSDHGFMLDGANQGGLVQVESIVSSDGTENVGGLTGNYNTPMVELSQTTGTVKFLEPGVYRVRLRVLDHDNVEATFTIPFVVDFALAS